MPAGEVFSSVAHLLNLDLDIVFVDSTSTYWEVEGADELAELAEDPVDDEAGNPPRPARGGSVTPRTTARICRRW